MQTPEYKARLITNYVTYLVKPLELPKYVPEWWMFFVPNLPKIQSESNICLLSAFLTMTVFWMSHCVVSWKLTSISKEHTAPLNCQSFSIRLHNTTSHKTVILILATTSTWNLLPIFSFCPSMYFLLSTYNYVVMIFHTTFIF